ncbi:hypothetical protein BJ508DRAFT_323593 [Ascobolus immersus RN42]|uniref:Uncharacterized protein n=1 Tax=Ascobolus immersus RN42 TaxID=1160509 RepID=A0A3N4IEV4_ASCIM|nr:hypothetical protein BJ508DRAFT_323593 [Ascobolus immersus RN42]
MTSTKYPPKYTEDHEFYPDIEVPEVTMEELEEMHKAETDDLETELDGIRKLDGDIWSKLYLDLKDRYLAYGRERRANEARYKELKECVSADSEILEKLVRKRKYLTEHRGAIWKVEQQLLLDSRKTDRIRLIS